MAAVDPVRDLRRRRPRTSSWSRRAARDGRSAAVSGSRLRRRARAARRSLHDRSRGGHPRDGAGDSARRRRRSLRLGSRRRAVAARSVLAGGTRARHRRAGRVRIGRCAQGPSRGAFRGCGPARRRGVGARGADRVLERRRLVGAVLARRRPRRCGLRGPGPGAAGRNWTSGAGSSSGRRRSCSRASPGPPAASSSTRSTAPALRSAQQRPPSAP